MPYKIRGMKSYIFTLVTLLSLPIAVVQSKAVLVTANGESDTYAVFNSNFGGTAVETPDCSHKPPTVKHIDQTYDTSLKKQVFRFQIHVTPDNDMCQNFDRQRLEVKTYSPSPEYLKGRNGDTVRFSWNMRLPAGFQPSTKFTHLHQIKAVGGDDSDPIITLSPRYDKNGNKMEIIHVDSKGDRKVRATVSLEPFLNQWVHITEEITYGSKGKYKIDVRLMSNKKNILTFSTDGAKTIDMWRNGGTEFVRPKWGIYRSLLDKGKLRDEAVLYDSFCLAKKNDNCP